MCDRAGATSEIPGSWPLIFICAEPPRIDRHEAVYRGPAPPCGQHRLRLHWDGYCTGQGVFVGISLILITWLASVVFEWVEISKETSVEVAC